MTTTFASSTPSGVFDDEAQTKGAISYSMLLRRAAVGLGLASLYGLAIGLRQGGVALGLHAVGVPLGLLATIALGAPSLFVFLSMCRSPLDEAGLCESAAQGLASAGLLLAGLAPAACLFVVTSETPEAASGAVTLGLLFGGGIALLTLLRDVAERARGAGLALPLRKWAILGGFGLFAVILVTRIWTALLPVLGGAS